MPSPFEPENQPLEPDADGRVRERDDEEIEAPAPVAWQVPGGENVRVRFTSSADASELYLVNRGYALIAKGVGVLDLQLEPGQYKMRQRIGYCESVQDVGVSDHSDWMDVELPALAFPSPIPLPGTSLADAGLPRPFSLGEGNFRFVLRAPIDAGSQLDTATAEHMREEMRCLRIERFDGAKSWPMSDARILPEAPGVLVFDTTLPAGGYVIVQQREERRQLCLPVLMLPGQVTAVFSLALKDETARGEERLSVAVELDHAAIAMLSANALELPYEASLFRLEAARKGLGAGRRVYGWSGPDDVENILLTLMDLQLGLRSLTAPVNEPGELAPGHAQPAPEVDPGGLKARVQQLGAQVGQGNADVSALGYALKLTDAQTRGPTLTAPPLLRRSWDQLLATPGGNELLCELMDFAFQTEPSSTWFLWSEVPGVRTAALVEPPKPSAATNDEIAMASRVPQVTLMSAFKDILVSALHLGRRVIDSNLTRKRLGDDAQEHDSPMSIDSVEAILAALIANKAFITWLNQVQLDVQADDKVFADESMNRLFHNLRTLCDPNLVSMLGARAVARQVLTTLRLPQRRVIELVKELIRWIVGKVPDSDRQVILAALQQAAGSVQIWLKAGKG
ncbi:hypothetical protein [Pseudomonas sp. NPDC090201]|uniref:hypothetical protein n=1 Tax=Pseudomonas sp. NPDC090201 TaxID=3364475 RepID=UPI0037FEA56C